MYIEATPIGHPLYLKHGFDDVAEVVVDLSKWGGTEKGINRIMIREPKPVSTAS